jgi:uncharacterized protein (TIGR03437 family)
MKISALGVRRGVLAALPVILSLLVSTVLAQEDRIAAKVDENRRTILKGNVNPKAQPQFDQGPVDPLLKLDLVTLAFRPSPQQQASLEQLLMEQQDRSSSNYHHWLTPEQYADRFGLSLGDIGKVRLWLESQGFTVSYVGRGRNWLTFSGAAPQVAKAFHTEIHRYAVDGEIHFANAAEPSIPAAFEPIVLGILGLDDFLPRPPQARFRGESKQGPSRPAFTTSNGGHVLVPDDVGTIYDIARLYQAGIDGSGQRVVVAGQSDISLADIATFRSGILPVNVPQVLLVPGSSDPGITENEFEADLDLEWVGAVARNATVIYVNSTDVLASAAYAISENLAPIISYSFGGCEQNSTTTLALQLRAAARQANLQGISLISASGDSGAAGCDKAFAGSQATQGIGVLLPASIPEVTAVGGTEFNEGSGNYWSNTNSPTGASVLSYIPEIGWNESGSQGLAASGGGFSIFYPQPSWQRGPGVPSINARAVPDVAMDAAIHDAYTVIMNGQAIFATGTSAATPVFAGIIALLNQHERSNGQGNINANLYRLAQTNIFHDITTGNNIVPCFLGTPNCTNGSFGYFAGPGYDQVTGLGSVDAYNLITEWNAATPVSNVVASCNPDPVYEQAPDSNGFSWPFTLTVNERAGVSTTLTDFTVNGTSFASQIVSFFGTAAIPANGAISAPLGYKTLTVPITLVFGFTGVDAGGRQWSQQLSVPFKGTQQSSTPPPSISAIVNAASDQRGASSGEVATLFGTNLSPVVGIESPGGATLYKGVSLKVGGYLAPLFTVANVNGQEQINFQVPMGLAAPGIAQVQLNNNGSIGIASVSITEAQPGIFEYVPSGSSGAYAIIVKPDGSIMGPSNPASRGTTVVMFMTGLGSTSPALTTGQPGPIPPVTTTHEPVVTLNGVGMPVLFSGIAPGFIGLDQVNFTIPAHAPVGSDLSLSVSVNGVSSQISGIAVQ